MKQMLWDAPCRQSIRRVKRMGTPPPSLNSGCWTAEQFPCEQGCDLRCLFKDVPLALPRRSTSERILSANKEDVDPGIPIFLKGDQRRTIVMIRSGLVKLVDYSRLGCERILLLAGKGNVIGLEALLKSPVRHDAVAIQPTSICRIPVEMLEQSASARPELHQRLMAFWQDTLAFAEQSLSGFNWGPTPARIARLILSRRAAERANRPNEINLLSRQDMAAILGVTPENISRSIAALRRQKILRKLKRDVYLCDLARMQELAEA